MEKYLQVGVISSTHGIKGEVKVFPTTDDVNRFKKLKEVQLDTGKEKILLHPESVKFFAATSILTTMQWRALPCCRVRRARSPFAVCRPVMTIGAGP